TPRLTGTIAMAQTPPPGPPSGPPRNKSQSMQPAFEEADFADFEADATNINQIPNATPRPGHPSSQPAPQNFAAPSPSLSHVGAPSQQMAAQPMYGASMLQHSSVMQQMPGPPNSQVSGVIAQPTPYVSRSRIYAFVVDETGNPIE